MRITSTLTLSHRLTRIKRTHRSLEEQIERAQRLPYPNSLRITHLKKLRMKAKEEIVILDSIIGTIDGEKSAAAA